MMSVRVRAALAKLLLVSLIHIAAGKEDYLGRSCLGSTCDNGLPCMTIMSETCEDTDPIDTICTCGGVGEVMDPFFTGFSGQEFYFPAEAGEIYNLFMAKDYLINARFIDNTPESKPETLKLASAAEHSSFIGTISLWHGNTKVQVSSDEHGNLSVLVNDSPLHLDQLDWELGTSKDLGDDVMLRSEGLTNDLSNGLVLETELVTLVVTAEDFHVHNLGYTVKGHLNIQLILNANRETAPALHGVLGQTVDASLVARERDGFPGGGKASDYAVSSLFGADFRLNIFSGSLNTRPAGKQAPKQPKVQFRRHLLLEPQEFYSQEPIVTASAKRRS